jgi:hypothetical protein
MATTTNYGWTTPDDTALVKDGASAIRSLGTSVDTTTKNLNPSTTLGDIEYRSSTANTNTRLAIGSTGQVLTVSGGVPTWAAAAGGGSKNYTLLNSGGTTISGSTTTVSGISNKDDLLVIVDDPSLGGGSGWWITVNSIAADYFASGNIITVSGSYSQNNIASSTYDQFTYIPMGTSSGQPVSGSCRISGAAGTGGKVWTAIGGGQAGGGSDQVLRFTQGFIPASAAITSVSVGTGGSFSGTGKIYVYGA